MKTELEKIGETAGESIFKGIHKAFEAGAGAGRDALLDMLPADALTGAADGFAEKLRQLRLENTPADARSVRAIDANSLEAIRLQQQHGQNPAERTAKGVEQVVKLTAKQIEETRKTRDAILASPSSGLLDAESA